MHYEGFCQLKQSQVSWYLVNDTHMEEFDPVQKFIETQGLLLQTFFICLHNQWTSFNSIIVQMSEIGDSSSKQ